MGGEECGTESSSNRQLATLLTCAHMSRFLNRRDMDMVTCIVFSAAGRVSVELHSGVWIVKWALAKRVG